MEESVKRLNERGHNTYPGLFLGNVKLKQCSIHQNEYKNGLFFFY